MRKTRTLQLLTLAAGGALVLAACGGDDGGSGGGDGELAGAKITVGSKEFNEQVLLGQIAIQALEAAGAEVTDETGIQGSENVRKALESDQIDLYWEYTGTGYTVHQGKDAADAPDDPAELAEEVKAEDEKNGIVWLDFAEANNTYAVAATKDAAQEHDLKTLSDYAELANSDPEAAKFCIAAEFRDRADGWIGVQKTYGFELPQNLTPDMDEDVIYTTMGKDCDFGEVFATDGRIAANDFVVLEDDKDFFVKYNIAPTVRQDTLDEYPEIADVLNPISKALTNEKMQELNEQVDVEEQFPEDVAEQFLQDEGLID